MLDPHSHRSSNSKFVRIDATKPNGSHAIITCEKNKMAASVKRYQDSGYTVKDIKQT